MRASTPLLLLVSAVVVSTWAAGCVTAPSDPSTVAARFTSIDQGTYGQSDSTEPRQTVIETQSEWETFWARHDANRQAPGGDPPAVSFDDAFVVVIEAGQRGTGGNGVAVENITFLAGNYEVDYVNIKPGPDCFTTQAITYPYHIVEVERVELADGDAAVTYVDRDELLDCE